MAKMFSEMTRYGCLQHLLAGAMAGVAEHAVMFPVDTIKTRMQALAHPGQRVSRPAHNYSS